MAFLCPGERLSLGLYCSGSGTSPFCARFAYETGKTETRNALEAVNSPVFFPSQHGELQGWRAGLGCQPQRGVFTELAGTLQT